MIFELNGAHGQGPRFHSLSLVDELTSSSMETRNAETWMMASNRLIAKIADKFREDINIPFTSRSNIVMVLKRVKDNIRASGTFRVEVGQITNTQNLSNQILDNFYFTNTLGWKRSKNVESNDYDCGKTSQISEGPWGHNGCACASPPSQYSFL